jgi:hypothetical protein
VEVPDSRLLYIVKVLSLLLLLLFVCCCSASWHSLESQWRQPYACTGATVMQLRYSHVTHAFRCMIGGVRAPTMQALSMFVQHVYSEGGRQRHDVQNTDLLLTHFHQ